MLKNNKFELARRHLEWKFGENHLITIINFGRI
jgi:hypothetical protein